MGNYHINWILNSSTNLHIFKTNIPQIFLSSYRGQHNSDVKVQYKQKKKIGE